MSVELLTYHRSCYVDAPGKKIAGLERTSCQSGEYLHLFSALNCKVVLMICGEQHKFVFGWIFSLV